MVVRRPDESGITMRSRTLFRYLLRQALGAVLMALVVLVAITLALFMAELLGDVADGELFGGALPRLLLLRLPEAILLTAPLALLIGLLMSLGELAVSEEFSVMRTAGAAPRTLAGVLLAIGLLWSAVLVGVAGWAQPWAARETNEIARRMAEDWLLAAVLPGRFTDLGVRGLTLYVGDVDREQARLSEVFIHHRGEQRSEVITAREGWLERDPESGAGVLTLIDGIHVGHAVGAIGFPLRRVVFERNRIELPAQANAPPSSETGSLQLPALIAGDAAPLRVELMRRLQPALACLIMVWFVLPSSLGSSRDRRGLPVLLTLAAYLGYSNLTGLLLGRLRDSGAGAWLNGLLWLPHWIMAGIALLVVLRWWRKW